MRLFRRNNGLLKVTDPIRVYLINPGREYWYLQWTDPTTGGRKTETTKCKKRPDAERKRVAKEDELNRVIPRADGTLGYGDFVQLYGLSHLESLAPASKLRSMSVLEMFGTIIKPATIGHISTATVVKFIGVLRKSGSPNKSAGKGKGVADSTLKGYLATLRAALSWAKSAGYLDEIPKMPKLPRAAKAKAKGRPLTDKEFVALLRSVRGIVGRAAARSWRRLLIGMWLSGLRLAEALELSWDDQTRIWLDTTSGPFPLLGIAAEAEKGFQNRLMPITPDFGRWILKTPAERRTGPVFPLVKARYKDVMNSDHASKVITKIGRASGVKVSASGKFASAHDLRRTFGLRWSQKRYPAELQQMMRHENIQTTMAYYAVSSATDLAARLWASEDK